MARHRLDRQGLAAEREPAIGEALAREQAERVQREAALLEEREHGAAHQAGGAEDRRAPLTGCLDERHGMEAPIAGR